MANHANMSRTGARSRLPINQSINQPMIVLAPKKGEKSCLCFSPRRLRKFPNSLRWIKKWAFPYVERLVFWFYSEMK